MKRQHYLAFFTLHGAVGCMIGFGVALANDTPAAWWLIGVAGFAIATIMLLLYEKNPND